MQPRLKTLASQGTKAEPSNRGLDKSGEVQDDRSIFNLLGFVQRSKHDIDLL